MNKYFKIVIFGFLLWLIPFFVGFLFFDQEGNLIISEIFFKSIMIVVGSLFGVIFGVTYFMDIEEDF